LWLAAGIASVIKAGAVQKLQFLDSFLDFMCDV